MNLRAPSLAVIISVSLHAGMLGLAVFVTLSVRAPSAPPPVVRAPILVRWVPRMPQVPAQVPVPVPPRPELDEHGAPDLDTPRAPAVTGLYRGSARTLSVAAPAVEPGLPRPAIAPPATRAILVGEPTLPPPSARLESRAPLLVSELHPRYPRECRRRGHEGVVELLLEVDAQGHVVNAKITRRGPCPHLDAAAVETARGLQYRPARRNGRTEPARTSLRVRFTLGP